MGNPGSGVFVGSFFRIGVNAGILAMTAFDLEGNPFAVLGVSSRDGRDAIAQAYEDRQFDGEIDESELLKAQQALMASRPRLSAEVAWLTGVAPKRAREVVRAASRSAIEALGLDDLPPLASANVAASTLSHVDRDDLFSVLFHLAICHGELEASGVCETINAERSVAGFPQVERSLVADSLAALRETHVRAAVSGVTRFEDPGHVITELAEEVIEQRDGTFDFVDEVVEAFDRWTEPHLREIEETLDSATNALRAEPSAQPPLDEIERLLERWDDFNQARQLMFEAKGLDEPRSRAVYDKLRSFAVDLHNEHTQSKAALRISKALLHTFPELPTVIDQGSEDVSQLEEVVEHSRHFGSLEPLIAAIEAATSRSSIVSCPMNASTSTCSPCNQRPNRLRPYQLADQTISLCYRPLPLMAVHQFCQKWISRRVVTS
jgi:hypothetical protein